MTNPRAAFEKTNPICERPNECNIFYSKLLWRFNRFGTAEKQSQSPACGRKSEARNTKSETRTYLEPDLKKQSQFFRGKMNATLSFARLYENTLAPDSEENKAKQSQFQTGRLLISRMCPKMGWPIYITLEIGRYIDIETVNVLFVLDEIFFLGDESKWLNLLDRRSLGF
jgi:hypothetical protein